MLVFFFGLIVTEVRRRLGWRGAIIGVQTAGVVMLALMGLTELWKHAGWALPVALVCFIFRRPLSNRDGFLSGADPDRGAEGGGGGFLK